MYLLAFIGLCWITDQLKLDSWSLVAAGMLTFGIVDLALYAA